MSCIPPRSCCSQQPWRPLAQPSQGCAIPMEKQSMLAICCEYQEPVFLCHQHLVPELAGDIHLSTSYLMCKRHKWLLHGAQSIQAVAACAGALKAPKASRWESIRFMGGIAGVFSSKHLRIINSQKAWSQPPKLWNTKSEAALSSILCSLCRLYIHNKTIRHTRLQILSFPMGPLLLPVPGSYLNIVLPICSQSKALGFAIQIRAWPAIQLHCCRVFGGQCCSDTYGCDGCCSPQIARGLRNSEKKS